MTDIALDSFDLTPSRRLARWVQVSVVILGLVALAALSFAIGRATMGHDGTTSTVVRPAVVQPVAHPYPQPICRGVGPC